MLRRLAVRLALAHVPALASVLFASTPSFAGVPSFNSAPAALVRETRRACRSAAAPVFAGPWPSQHGAYWAALVWREGSHEACLVMFRVRGPTIARVGHGNVPAGNSERYGEWYAPTLRPDPVTLGHQLPMPVTDALAMGGAGGGGDLTTVWQSIRGRWRRVFDAGLAGATDIDSATEHPCQLGIPLAVEHDILEATECFDGASQRSRWRWTGTRFARRAGCAMR